MFKKIITKQNFLIITIFCIILFFCLYKIDVEAGSQLVSIKGNSDISKVGRETLEILITLKSLKLDNSLFREPIFKSLKDFSIELGEKNVGRENPFMGFVISGKTSVEK